MQPDEQHTATSDQVTDTTPNTATQSAATPQYSDDDTRDIETRVAYASDFIDDDEDAKDVAPIDLSQPVKWQAKEYIAPEKNTIWYIGLGVVVVAVILLDIFYVHSYTLTALILAIAAVLIVMSVRPARVIDYTLSEKGLYIGDNLVNLSEYKAFGVIHDGKENSLMLIPIKRFKPALSVYFPVESGELIVDNLAERLPMQEFRADFIDKIVQILRL